MTAMGKMKVVMGRTEATGGEDGKRKTATMGRDAMVQNSEGAAGILG